MINSKLFKVIQALNPGELRRFKRWLNAGIHNSNPYLSVFYQYFEQKKEWTARSLKKEKAWAYVFPERPFQDLEMRRLMSDLFVQLEAFLSSETQSSNAINKRLSLAAVYRERHLTDLSEQQLRMADDELSEQPLRDADYYLSSYRLQEGRFLQEEGRAVPLNLQEMSHLLSTFFAAEMLRNACVAASHSSVFKAEYDIPYLDAILNDCEADKYQHAPVVLLYFHAYRCLRADDETPHFEALRGLLPEAHAWLRPVELRTALLFAVNYGIRRLNTGHATYLRAVFDLYQLGLQQGIFIENGVFSRFTFKNVVNAALRLNEPEWTAQFIADYAPLLPAPHRKAYEHYCTARLCYLRRDLERAQELLQDLEFDDIFLELDTRVTLLRIYFEQKEWRLLEAFLTTFEQFVRRKKTLVYHRQNYLNVVHFTQKLLHHHSGKRPLSAQDIELLKENISAAKPLAAKDWLLAQL
ncbi:MAG: hypothetical protein IT269_09490 [Saprospiraceae bacterium]|nr:hypothetical protein [Saprospiraceae bacterium]